MRGFEARAPSLPPLRQARLQTDTKTCPFFLFFIFNDPFHEAPGKIGKKKPSKKCQL